MDKELKCIENFKSLMRIAMTSAQHAHDFIFDKSVDKFVAVAYLNVAISKFSSAESFYYSQIEILEHSEAENIFHLFYVFSKEFLNNVRTHHSHQWTDIEFKSLKEAFDRSAFAFQNH